MDLKWSLTYSLLAVICVVSTDQMKKGSKKIVPAYSVYKDIVDTIVDAVTKKKHHSMSLDGRLDIVQLDNLIFLKQ